MVGSKRGIFFGKSVSLTQFYPRHILSSTHPCNSQEIAAIIISGKESKWIQVAKTKVDCEAEKKTFSEKVRVWVLTGHQNAE